MAAAKNKDVKKLQCPKWQKKDGKRCRIEKKQECKKWPNNKFNIRDNWRIGKLNPNRARWPFIRQKQQKCQIVGAKLASLPCRFPSFNVTLMPDNKKKPMPYKKQNAPQAISKLQ
jgi:hypothetical protein